MMVGIIIIIVLGKNIKILFVFLRVGLTLPHLFLIHKTKHMPNWCSNNVYIEADSDTILTFLALLNKEVREGETKHGVFRTLIGIKPNVSLEEYRIGAWYDANCDYWGCKWDIEYDQHYFDFDTKGGTLSFSCETAWSPCDAFLSNLVGKFKGIRFAEITYSESGMNYAGIVIYRRDADGNVNREDESYSFMEGLFHFDIDTFWCEVESNLEYLTDDGDLPETAEEFLKDYGYLPEVSKQEIGRAHV